MLNLARWRQSYQAGFTLAEMLLVVAILTIVLAIGAPLYGSLSNTNQQEAATGILAQDLYQAQVNSRAGAQDSAWGVAINGQVITLFAGSSYATRNTAYDVDYTAPSAISFGGSSQIIYSKLYGLPTATASFSVSGGGKTSNVAINSKGMVEY